MAVDDGLTCGARRGTLSGMGPRLQRLLDLLDEAGGGTVGTSMRLPVHLRNAAGVAIELGIGASTAEFTVQGMRAVLEAFAQRAALDAHYAAHPDTRPDLAEIALATAELDDHPIASHPQLIRRAADGVQHIKDDPTPDDVLVYAAGLAAAAA